MLVVLVRIPAVEEGGLGTAVGRCPPESLGQGGSPEQEDPLARPAEGATCSPRVQAEEVVNEKAS